MRSKKKAGGLGGMVSAMIPGAQVNNKGRILVNVGTTKETITFNIGGTLFETYRSTLFRLPNSPLANDKFLQEHYRAEKRDYFFDRDPDIFRATLNYLRTGELHIPSYICGPAAKTELEFWGVLPNKIERCCWTNYNDWNSTLDALNQLDQDRSSGMMRIETDPRREKTWWNTNQPKIWNFINSPESSFGAKLLGYFAILLVFLSIFSFIAGTTPYFKDSNEEIQTPHNKSNTTAMGIDTTVENSTAETETKFSVSLPSRKASLFIIDIICLVFFTSEYIIRLIFSPKKIKFMTSILGLIDLFAILPEYIELIAFAIRPDFRMDIYAVSVISFIKILRVLRIFRLIKHVPGLWILVYTLKASVGELVLLACFMMVGILVFSSLIYFCEEQENFPSIPEAFWWALITMTTVGYGDMYPTTTLGKFVGSLCAMSGLLMIGFSVPALVNNFMLFYKHTQFALQAEKEAKYEANEKKTKYSEMKALNHNSGPFNKENGSHDQEEMTQLMVVQEVV